MADSTLNRFVSSGTTAERTAFVPDPPTPASGPDVLYLWWDTTLEALYAYDFVVPGWVAAGGSGGIGGSTGATDEAVLVADGVGGATLQATPVLINSTTGAVTFPDDVRQTFNPGANNAGINVGSLAGDPATPSNGDLWYDSTANELTARINGASVALGAGGGGGNSTSSTAVGSEPGGASSGDLDLYTNAAQIARYSGSAWVPWGPIWPLADPTLQTFSWVNQGGASVSTTNGGIALTAPATAGDDFRLRVKTAPGTPYTITAMIEAIGAPIASSFGLAFRESGSGALHLFLIGGNSLGSLAVFSIKFTSPTTFSGVYTSTVSTQFVGGYPPRFLRIADDGSNRICSLSQDGYNFYVFHTVGRTDFLTADQVGFFCNASSASAAAVATLLSWLEA